MSEVVTAPYLLASLVLCVAGTAKLRRPAAASRALRDAGLPGDSLLVRAFALGELALGGWGIVAPSAPVAVGLGLAFVLFTVLAALLARRASACGCFGSADAPASVAQSLLSASFALVAAAALLWPPHGLGWVLGRPPSIAVAMSVGLFGAVYATVLAYTELPAAWRAWGAA